MTLLVIWGVLTGVKRFEEDIAHSDSTLLTIYNMFIEFLSVIGPYMNLLWCILQPSCYELCRMSQVFIKVPLQLNLWEKYIIINSLWISNLLNFPHYCVWNRWFPFPPSCGWDRWCILFGTIPAPVCPMTILSFSP